MNSQVVKILRNLFKPAPIENKMKKHKYSIGSIIENTIIGAIAITAAWGPLVYLTLVCSDLENPKEKKTTVQRNLLLEGALEIIKEEDTNEFRMNVPTTSAVCFVLDFKKPGQYHLEGWAERHREPDIKVLDQDYEINEPRKEKVSVYSFVKRLEASAQIDGRLRNDNISVGYRGLTTRFVNH